MHIRNHPRNAALLGALVLLTFVSNAAVLPSNARYGGKTLQQWMKIYWEWAYTGAPVSGQQIGNAILMPIPETGHLDITIKPGTAFVLPIICIVGERYANGSEDDPGDFLWRQQGTVILDNKVVVDTSAVSTTNRAQPYFVAATRFDAMIPYAEETDYGAIGAVWFSCLGFVCEPLSVGDHSIVLDSQESVFDDPPFVSYHNTWTIHVVP